VHAAIGRTLNETDVDAVAVISHRAWQRRFAADPGVIGRAVRLQRLPFTIVGVAEEGFFGVAPGLAPEIFVPVMQQASLSQDSNLKSPHTAWLHLMGRLKTGITMEQANAALAVSWPRIMEAVTPESMPRERRALYLGRKTQLMAGHNGFSRVRNQFARPLWVLFALVGLLLAAAAASLANLFLVRAASRQKEMAVRLALGASPARLVRQWMVEGLLLGMMGAALGVLLGRWGGRVLEGLMATRHEPIVLDLTIRWTTWMFAVAAGLAAVLLPMAGTALHAVRSGISGWRDSHRTIGGGREHGRLGNLLVVAQLGLCQPARSNARAVPRRLVLHPGSLRTRRRRLLRAPGAQ
jgi:ABC-type antimicrobial peptide transport system permease subunit